VSKINFLKLEVSQEQDQIGIKNKDLDFTEIDLEVFRQAQAEWDAYILGIRMKAYIAGLCERCGHGDSVGHRCEWPPKFLGTAVA